VQEILAQQVALTETYLQIFERADWTAEQAAANAEQAAVDGPGVAVGQLEFPKKTLRLGQH
jgi:2-oxo-4-hydroxy-4-carboxy--5-ureidoimidazoline (OHCU) decarboxylase